MLAREHRITSSQDFAAVTRGGQRSGTSTVVVSVLIRPSSAAHASEDSPEADWRCGFIVSKKVGNAVVRHRTTRRLRHIVREVIRAGEVSLPEYGRVDVVIRALAESASADHPRLRTDVLSGLRRALGKAEKARA